MDLIKHGGRRVGGKVSCLQGTQNFHCSSLFLLHLDSWKLLQRVHSHTPHPSSACLHQRKRIFRLGAASVCWANSAFSHFATAMFSPSLFPPSSHSNPRRGVSPQCCRRLHQPRAPHSQREPPLPLSPCARHQKSWQISFIWHRRHANCH